MAKHLDELERRGAAVLVVSFGAPAALDDFRARMGLPFPIAGDLDRRAYRAYGMMQGSAWQIWHPRTLWRYARLRVGGTRLQRPAEGDDLSQLGGDFVIDADGVLRLCHASARPDDRPSLATLLAALPVGGPT